MLIRNWQPPENLLENWTWMQIQRILLQPTYKIMSWSIETLRSLNQSVWSLHVCLSLSTNYTSSCKPFILHDVLSTKFDTNYSNSVSIAVWYNDSWNTPIQMDHQKRTGKTKLKSFPPLWMYLRTFFFTIPRFVPNLSSLSSIQWQSHKDQKMPASSLHGSKRLQQLENGDPAITNSGQFDTSLINKSRKLKS